MKLPLSTLLSVAAVTANPFAQKTTNNAKGVYVSNLLRKAKVVRELDDYDVDISSYSVKFTQCQLVRSFDDDLAADEGSSTVLGTSRFAIFRLCPDDECDSCNKNYGEYILDLQSYLELTVEHFQEVQQEMCNYCGQWCDADGQDIEAEEDDAAEDGGRKKKRQLADGQKPENLNCNECVEECAFLDNMEDNGYVDALEFMNCVKIYDDGQENGVAYYAAPACVYSGAKIRIGVFSDEECTIYQKGKDVEDYIEPDGNGNPRSISNLILQKTYKDTCISCRESQDYNNANDENDADEVHEVCENLYNYAGKCEQSNGFQNGYAAAEGYENQARNEEVICKYINSLKSGTYDEYGEINLSGGSYSFYGSGPTTAQRFALTFFILGTIGLSVYAAVIHSKLNKRRRRQQQYLQPTLT